MRPCPQGLVPPLLLLLAAIAAAVHAAGQQRVVCYYTNWSVYRPGNAKFSPQNINPYLCTHLIYAFGGLTKENSLKPFDKYQDIEQGGYAKFNGLKTYNKQLKTLLAIGGWNEGSTRFSPLVADDERRVEFVKNVVRFLRQNNFDGLDLDWEYPAFRDGGKPRDRANYAKLVQELRAEFDRESSKTGRVRLLLTMAVPAGTDYVDKGYDIPSLNRDLDFMNILSYDYHSAFEPVVNHHAPLYSGGDPDNEYNYDAELSIEHTIKHYVSLGADRDKLVLGIPTYGRSYTLFNPIAKELGSAADGPGEQGDATREKGYLAYYEICDNVKKHGWTVEHPKPDEMGPIAYKGNQWVGYDDEDIVKVKARYVATQGLGGIMFWSIDNDDFRGKCHDRPYPLIEAGKEALLAAGKKPSESKRTKPTSSSSRRQRPTSAPITSSATSSKRRRPSSRAQTTSSTTTTSTTTTPVPPNLSLLNTPEPPTTPDPGSDFVCKDEGFYSHPRDCKKYFWCLDSGPSQLGIVAHQFTCPSGLVFNKAADSCDYARNVICSKTKTTTAAPTTSTTTTSAPSTSRSPVYRPITTTTTTTTTPAPEEDEEEYEEEDEYEEAEDPKAIKELLDLIKKLGGVEQLERQLSGSGRSHGEETEVSSVAPKISESLYNRVLGSRSRVTNSGGPSFVPSNHKANTETENERKTFTPSTRSRGPQNQGLDEFEEVRGVKKEKPKYTEIRRPVNRNKRPDSDEEEGEVEEDDVSSEEESEAQTSAPAHFSRPNQRPSNVPKYTSIRRERPSSTTPEPEDEASEGGEEESEEEEEVEEQRSTSTTTQKPFRKYVPLSRSRPTVATTTTTRQPEVAAEDEDEVAAVVLEVVAPPPSQPTSLEFEGLVEEVKQVGYRNGNALRRQIASTSAELTTVPSPQKEDEASHISIVNAVPTRASGFFITQPHTSSSSSSPPTNDRVFVVNAVTTTSTTTTTALPETTLTTTEVPTTTTNPPTTTLEEVTETVTDTPAPKSTTSAPISTSTITRVVTSITESPIIGRKIIYIHRNHNFTLNSLFESPSITTSMTPVSEAIITEEIPVTTEAVEISTELSTTTTEKPLRNKRPPLNRGRRPSFKVSTTEKPEFSIKPLSPRRRVRPIPTRNSLDLEVSTEPTASLSPKKFQRRPSRIRYTTTTTTTAAPTSPSRRRFRPSKAESPRDEELPPVDNPITLRTPTRLRPVKPESSITEEIPVDNPTLRTPTRRRKVVRVNSRRTTTTPVVSSTTTTETSVVEDIVTTGDDDDDTAETASSSGNEVFLTSSTQIRHNQDEVVDEENEILTATDDDNHVHFEEHSTTSTTTEAPPSSTARSNFRPASRRPVIPAKQRGRTTVAPETISTIEPSEEAPSSARPRVVLRRKYRPFKETTAESRDLPESTTLSAAIASTQRANLFKGRRVVRPLSRSSTTTSTEEPVITTTTAVGETSPLLSQQSPAVYYTKQPAEVTEVVTTQDQDLANAAVAALANLANSPPTASGATNYYDDIPLEDEEDLEPVTPATTTTTTRRPRPPRPTTAAPTPAPVPLRTRSQRPASVVTQQKPFTRIRGPASTPAKTSTITQQQQQYGGDESSIPDFEDFYDDEQDPLLATNSKVKIHEDGSLECLDRGNFAHPFSCRKFISCALMENGALLGWIYTCPKHLAFDPIGGICNWSGGCKE
ncbi:hypothetical protein B566_EDAN006080 [Ephemera danica]|nr:hypothetical protein B566_EDAN006080 [Ephemera danica]